MNYADFKKHAGVLGRFANIREGAPEPSDRIIVQAKDNELKFIAGTDYDESRATVVVYAEKTDQAGMAVVNARTFLSAAKSLKGKGTIGVLVSKDGIVLQTSGGGEVTLGNVSTKIPSIVKPADGMFPRVDFDAGFLPQAARLLVSTTSMASGAFKQVQLDVTPKGVMMRGGDKFMFTQLDLGGSGYEPFVGAIPPDFLESVKDFDGAGSIWWGERQIAVQSGPYKAVAGLMDRFPAIAALNTLPWWRDELDTHIKMNRKRFVEAVKTLTDEKVTLNVTPKDAVLAGWPNETTSLKLEALTDGRGRMAVMRDRLGKLIDALQGDEVTLAWSAGNDGPVRLWDQSGTVFLSRIPLF